MVEARDADGELTAMLASSYSFRSRIIRVKQKIGAVDYCMLSRTATDRWLCGKWKITGWLAALTDPIVDLS
jgi:hypothetical protein